MRELIVSLKGEHTVLLSTHQLYEAAKICDEVTIIHNGDIKQTGTIEELRKKIGGVKGLNFLFKGNGDLLKSELHKMDGIVLDKVECFGACERFCLHVNSQKDRRGEIAKIVSGMGDLLEFGSEDIDLEKIFREVIHDEV